VTLKRIPEKGAVFQRKKETKQQKNLPSEESTD
jgi:hypothetical protein